MSDFDHAKFTALCVLLNSEGGMSALEYDEYLALLYRANAKLTHIAERKSCVACEYFQNRVCSKAGKEPPDHVQKTGCEQYFNKYQIPF